MKLSVTYTSTHPVIMIDRAFFASNPHRRYRARGFLPDEIGLPLNVVVFAIDERGENGELNLVILTRIKGVRIRYHFAAFADSPLNTDRHIKAFLRSRGVQPFQHNWKGKRP